MEQMVKEINEIKINQAEQSKDICYIRDEVKSHKEETAELRQDIKKFIESAEHKFAGKWTENAMKYAMYAVAGTLITALLALILK